MSDKKRTKAVMVVLTLVTVAGVTLSFQNCSGGNTTVNVVDQVAPQPQPTPTPAPPPFPGVILNLHNTQVVQTGFVIGTAPGSVSAVGCQFDSGTVQTATGTANWSCALPNGSNTWRLGTQHTITVGTLVSGAFAQATTITATKGNNHDINGDGYVDLLVGTPPAFSTECTGFGSCTFNISYGSANGIPTNTWLNQGLPASALSAEGTAIALADVNGDGYADVIIGDYLGGINSHGLVYIFYGSSSGIPTTPSVTLTGPSNNSEFGYSIAVGDINGDGYSDIVIGAPGVPAVYDYAGTSSGISATATSTLTGTGTFGTAIAVGSLHGNGYGDVLVGGNNSVYVYNGSSGGVAGSASTILTGASGFGNAMAIGDVNGDGYADVAVGGSGSVFIYEGASGGLSTTASGTLAGPSGFGSSIVTGDITRSGYADVIIESTSDLYIFNGSSNGVSASASTTLSGYGSNFASTGDYNGDGYVDVVVSIKTGGVYDFAGSSSGVPSTPTSTVPDVSGPVYLGIGY